MTNEEARLVLSAYRPGGADASDRLMREALEQAQRDPEMREWFERQRKFDEAIAENLRGVAVPGGLRASILTGGRIVRTPPLWRRPALLAAAALVALILAAGALFWQHEKEQSDFRAFQLAMAQELQQPFELDLRSADINEARAWLARHDAPAPRVLDQRSPTLMGCKIFEWRGQKVSLICFQLGDSHVAHLLSVPAEVITAPEEVQPAGKFSTVAWTEEGTTYLLMGHLPEKELSLIL